MKESNGEETCRGPARRQDFLSSWFHSGQPVTKGQRQYCWLTGLRVQAGRKTKLVFQAFLPSADVRHAAGERREDAGNNEVQPGGRATAGQNGGSASNPSPESPPQRR